MAIESIPPETPMTKDSLGPNKENFSTKEANWRINLWVYWGFED
jgi:hypothetical protein